MKNLNNFQTGNNNYTQATIPNVKNNMDMQNPSFHDFVGFQQQVLYNQILRSLQEGEKVDGLYGVMLYCQGYDNMNGITSKKDTLEQMLQQYGCAYGQQQIPVQGNAYPQAVPFIQQQASSASSAPVPTIHPDDVVMGTPVVPQDQNFLNLSQSYYMQVYQNMQQQQYSECYESEEDELEHSMDTATTDSNDDSFTVVESKSSFSSRQNQMFHNN